MQEQFVTYEIALKLKELGFNEECLCTYVVKTKELHRNPSNDMIEEEIKEPYTWINSKIHPSVCTAPLWQQAIDWLRENHKIHIVIHGDNFNSLYEFTGYGFQIFKTKWNVSSENIILFSSPSLEEFTYNNAREQAILKAIELCHNKK